MKTLLKYLKEMGFEVDEYLMLKTPPSHIFCKKETGSLTVYVKVSKDYKGYNVEKAEFIGNSIGKTIGFKTKSVKEVIQGLNLR